MKNLNVLYQASDYYAPYACTSIISLLKNNTKSDMINIYILSDNISNKRKEKILKLQEEYLCNVKIIDASKIDKQLEKLGIRKYGGSYATYYKFYAPKLIQEDLDKLIYIDSDTLVIGELNELMELDMKEYSFAMTVGITFDLYKKYLKIPLKRTYYNGGVIVFNIKQYIKSKCAEKVIKHIILRKGGYGLAADESIINRLFFKDILRIHLKYNAPTHIQIYNPKEILKIYDKNCTTIQEIVEAKKHTIIHHLVGGVLGRPWEADNIHPQEALFDHYLELSPFKGYKKIKVNRNLIYKIQRFMWTKCSRKVYFLFFKFAAEYNIFLVERRARNKK